MEKTCPACGGTLEMIQEDVFLRFDTPFRFGDCLSMNVYQCVECRRLEFYSTDPVEQQKPDPDEMVTCPECGEEHSKYINCPNCLRKMGWRNVRIKKDEEKKRPKKGVDPWDYK